ncbi:MAG: (2Fe-2S)-binding protein [Rhodobacteraceae bacterium]|nr:(2Fe-2S)-binding protein [Paracoccaceae bacterium]
MIVCQCQSISDHDIRAAVAWMRAADARTIITPGKIYHALGKRADCGGCMPLFLDTMRAHDSFEVPMNLRGLRRATDTGTSDEGRQEGYRVSERGAAV